MSCETLGDGHGLPLLPKRVSFRRRCQKQLRLLTFGATTVSLFAIGVSEGRAAFSSSTQRPGKKASTHRWRRVDEGSSPEWLPPLQDGQVITFEADSVPRTVYDEPFKWMQVPFIIRSNSNLEARQEALQKDALLDEAIRADLSIGVGRSWSISQNRGEGPQRMKLKDFLSKGIGEALFDGKTSLEPAYAFDRTTDLQNMPDGNDIHPSIRSWNESAFNVPESAISIRMLGGPGSAVGWHCHGATVQMVVHGRKRWLLYPLDRYPPGDGPGGGFSITDWVQLIYPTLEDSQKPVECIVGPGDMIYVPDGWYHAVINLADSVAVSIQSEDIASEHQQFFKHISLPTVERIFAEDPSRVEDLAVAAKSYVEQGLMNDLHARRVLFYCFLQTDVEEAVHSVLEFTRRDPFHVPMQFELASWLDRQMKAGNENALQLFKKVMAEWKPFLMRNTRNLKALWILNKYERAMGNIAEADEYYDRLVDLNERGIDR